MRILQIIPHFYPARAFGGVVRCVYEFSRELVRRGHEVTIHTANALNFRTDFKVSKEEYYIDSIKVRYFRNVARLGGLYISPGMIHTSRKEIQNSDIIHMHGYRTFQNIITHFYARKYKRPYVLSAHGSLPRIIARQKLKWIYDVFSGFGLLKDASRTIALSQLESQQYRNMGVAQEKIEVIPNGISLSDYNSLSPKGSFRKKFSIDEDEKIILYLGRIHKSKGLDLLAHAFSIVVRDLSNVKLVAVGPDDGYVATFYRLISDLEIEKKVILTGFVKKRDKLAALSDSDVFVTPYFLGFPFTFLEACLMECPIITTSNELDWVHDNVGYVVENSPTAFAKAISSILHDEETRERFKNNCRHVIKNFDISKVTSQLEEAYKSVLHTS